MIVFEEIDVKGCRILAAKVSENEYLDSLHLSHDAMDLYKGIKNVERKKIFLITRALAKNLGIETFSYDLNRKPILQNGEFISISHSGDWVLVAKSEKPIGIDIEKISERILKIKNRFLSNFELNNICENDLAKMVLLWSVKEAIFKKVGGKTSFFKLHQRVQSINYSIKTISIAYDIDENTIMEEVCYLEIAEDYRLVYTM